MAPEVSRTVHRRVLGKADLVPGPGDRSRINWLVGLARAHGLRASPWNPLRGCRRAGAGCRSCWAAAVAWGRARHPHPAIAARHHGLVELDADGIPRFNGARRLIEDEVDRPLHARRPTVYFADSEGDLFYERHPGADVARVLGVMGSCDDADRGHLFLVLTKRYREMAEILLSGPAADAWNAPRKAPRRWPASNMVVGASVWDQPSADRARPHMARLAACGWPVMVSYEPALGPVDWTGWEFLAWLIAGGEAGAASRPSHPRWTKDAVAFAAAAGIAAFAKQKGDWDHDRDDNGEGEGDGNEAPDREVLWLHASGRCRRTPPADRCEPGWVPMVRRGKRINGLPEVDGRAVLEAPWRADWAREWPVRA